MYVDSVHQYFRRRRNKRLSVLVDGLHRNLNRPVKVLDVGGTAKFWENVDVNSRKICELTLMKQENPTTTIEYNDYCKFIVGDARNLSRFAGNSSDLVVSNSLIEHVGRWGDMLQCSKELRRVASSGWVRTPASAFPVDPHTMLPFVHWLAQPIRRRHGRCLLCRGHPDFHWVDRLEDVDENRPSRQLVR